MSGARPCAGATAFIQGESASIRPQMGARGARRRASARACAMIAPATSMRSPPPGLLPLRRTVHLQENGPWAGKIDAGFEADQDAA